MAHVSTSLEVCEDRDVKGLYAKARSGEIKNFTGVSDRSNSPIVPTSPWSRMAERVKR